MVNNNCAYKLSCYLWYYFLMRLQGEQRAADTSSDLLWTCPQNRQGVFCGFSMSILLLHFDSVVYWFAFLKVSSDFFFWKYFFWHVYFTDSKENCLIKMFLSKCFFTWVLTWAFSVWYCLLCLSYSHIIPLCIQNSIFTFSLSSLFT